MIVFGVGGEGSGSTQPRTGLDIRRQGWITHVLRCYVRVHTLVDFPHCSSCSVCAAFFMKLLKMVDPSRFAT